GPHFRSRPHPSRPRLFDQGRSAQTAVPAVTLPSDARRKARRARGKRAAHRGRTGRELPMTDRTMGAADGGEHTVDKNDRLVILASSVGTVIEWYDFYLYGSLAAIISAQFFSGVNETTEIGRAHV